MKLINYLMVVGCLLIGAAAQAGTGVDRDHDGIPDIRDRCPGNSFEELSKGVNSEGCPLQTDADGIPDYRDRCPNTPRGVIINANGCPVDSKINVKHHVFNNRALANIH